MIARRFEEGGVVSVAPDDTLLTAFQRMRLADVSQLPVLDGDKLVGVIDESDLLLQVHADAARFRAPVSERDDRCAADARAEGAAWPSCEAVLDRGLVAIVADDAGFHGLITRFDLLNHLRRTLDVSADPTRKRQACDFGTRVIHAGQSPDPATGAIMPPIYATSTYVQQSPGVHKGLDYGRSHNPTRWAFERCVADLEGGAQAFAFASGLAAISTVLELLDAGAHIVSGDDVYGGTLPPVRARAHAQRRATASASST